MRPDEDPLYATPVFWVWLVMQVASLIHVGWQSSHDRRIGNAFWHVGMNLLVCWPFPYLCWILWWPGSLRQAISGSDRERAHQWARSLIEERKRKGNAKHADGASP